MNGLQIDPKTGRRRLPKRIAAVFRSVNPNCVGHVYEIYRARSSRAERSFWQQLDRNAFVRAALQRRRESEQFIDDTGHPTAHVSLKKGYSNNDIAYFAERHPGLSVRRFRQRR